MIYRDYIFYAKQVCPVEICLNFVGGKWKLLILRRLSQDALRYNQLLRSIDGISPKMLTEQLSGLMQDGIVQKTMICQTPAKWEYSLTDFGKTLAPVVNSMYDWGNNYLEGLKKSEHEKI